MIILSRKRSSCASGKGYVPSYSMGFSVAKTVKSGESGCVSPSIVTCRSSIASRSAACVFGGVRLISSARRTSVKTGPRRSENEAVETLKTFVPVMSEGIRSGVNWMRLKSAPTMRASVFTSKVLAVPGTPSKSACPSAKSATSTCSTTASCPTMTLLSSVLMCSTVAGTY